MPKRNHAKIPITPETNPNIYNDENPRNIFLKFKGYVHDRHEIQQSEYIVSVSESGIYPDGEKIINFDGNFEITRNDELRIYKINGKRLDFLDRLDKMNINAYTVFGNIEGLMKTLYFREIEKRIYFESLSGGGNSGDAYIRLSGE